MNYLLPDYMFASYREVTPAFLKSIGVSALLSDVDNTLAPYELPEPDEELRAWIHSLTENGIRIALVSNNHADRILRFNASLQLPAFPNCGKPGKKRLGEALAAVGATPETSAVLGDQLFTDAVFGNASGMRTIIVPPIYDKRNLFFRTKRLLEIPVVKKYNKLHGTDFSTFRLPPKRTFK